MRIQGSLASYLVSAVLGACAQKTPPPPATGPTPAAASTTGPSQPVPAYTSSAAAQKAQAPDEASIPSQAAGRAAAEAWLAIVDAGSYAQSWNEAARLFKNAIEEAAWEKALNGSRAPLGPVRSRTLKSTKYATNLPGAPDGEYVVVLFDTSFEKKQHAVETVTPMKEADGRWRVSGYFIK
jgi:hypothetical protein